MFKGWEDTTDAALTFLLRTSLAKPGKENQGATPISLKSAKDTTRLRKHISSVIDRINKGGRISDAKNPIEGMSIVMKLGNRYRASLNYIVSTLVFFLYAYYFFVLISH